MNIIILSIIVLYLIKCYLYPDTDYIIKGE